MFSILKNPVYFRFWLGQIISQLGDGLTRIAIVYLVSTLSKDPLAIGFVIFAQLLPTAFLGVFSGPLADKYNRKFLMAGADFYRMVIILLMIPFHQSAFVLIALIFLHGIGSAVFDPARSSAIPDLVGEAYIQEATSLSQSTRAAMDIIGPSIGALLMLANDYSIIFAIDATTFIISCLLILTLTSLGKTKSAKDSSPESYFHSIKSGISEVTGMPVLRFLLIILIPITFCFGILNTNLIAVLTNKFHVSSFHFGLIEAASSVGVVAGAGFAAPKALKRFTASRVFLAGTAGNGILMLTILPVDFLQKLYGVLPIYLWSIMVGVLVAFLNVPLNSLFLKVTPAAFRGRGSSLLQITVNTSTILGIVAGGWLSREIGVLYGTACSGGLLIIVTAFIPLLKGYKTLSAKNKETLLEANPVSAEYFGG